ncbi:MAG TPA: TIGR03618 family F420-dependent PPOX class oxidoreductase [Dehalococcoidia bacterium]|nr:TIGR03618 family F420-dependent PPOX class oxidoreductase [Dehalococcoidia bacterium]
MNQAQIDEFLAERRNATLATVNKTGAPVQVPVFFDWHDGHAYVSVTTQRGFFPNLRSNPQVSLCVDDAGRPVRTVIVRGEVTVVEGEAHWVHTDRIIRKYVPNDQVEATLERMHSEPRVVLDVTPTMITSWSPTPADREVWRPT